jgi:predicted regulator of Ras-like GTPase activity (Roadblock/LC7/MglB family)
MQVVNLEKKTSALEIDMKGKKGIIYFKDGEVINGEYENLVGEEAVLKLIALNRGKISVKESKRKVRRVIEIPFMQYMIEISRTLDELVVSRDKEPMEDDVTETKKHFIFGIAIKKALQSLENVTGYLGAGIFSPDGDLIERVTVNRNIYPFTQFENIGILIRNALKVSQNITDELAFGPLKTIQLYGETGIIFLVCHNDEKSQFYTALCIKEDGNITMAKKKLQEVVEALKPELGSI